MGSVHEAIYYYASRSEMHKNLEYYKFRSDLSLCGPLGFRSGWMYEVARSLNLTITSSISLHFGSVCFTKYIMLKNISLIFLLLDHLEK